MVPPIQYTPILVKISHLHGEKATNPRNAPSILLILREIPYILMIMVKAFTTGRPSTPAIARLATVAPAISPSICEITVQTVGKATILK